MTGPLPGGRFPGHNRLLPRRTHHEPEPDSLIGRLATDPEARAGQTHEAASFRLAVPRRHRSDGTDPGAVFIEVVTFDGLAKTVAEYLTKGRQVAVTGRLEQNEWTAEDGSKRSRIQIIADEVSFLDAPKKTADLEAIPA